MLVAELWSTALSPRWFLPKPRAKAQRSRALCPSPGLQGGRVPAAAAQLCPCPGGVAAAGEGWRWGGMRCSTGVWPPWGGILLPKYLPTAPVRPSALLPRFS